MPAAKTRISKLWWLPTFLLILVLGDRAGAVLCSKLFESSQFRFSRLYSGQADADILLVGNSRGLTFHQPEIEALTGESTFNLSYNALPADLAEVLLADYLDRHQAPRLLILEASFTDRENDPLWRQFGMLSSRSKRYQKGLKARAPIHASACRLSQLFRYNSEIFHRSLYYLKLSDNTWLQSRMMTDDVADAAETITPLRLPVREAQLEALSRLVQLAEAQGIRVELVMAPYFPPFADRLEGYEAWAEALQAAVDVPLRDYRYAIASQDAFADYQHLNWRGSEEFVRLLDAEGVFSLER